MAAKAAEEQLWQQMKEILQKSNKPLNVLEIRRKLENPQTNKSLMNSILYRKEKNGQLQMIQESTNTKPKWILPPNNSAIHTHPTPYTVNNVQSPSYHQTSTNNSHLISQQRFHHNLNTYQPKPNHYQSYVNHHAQQTTIYCKFGCGKACNPSLTAKGNPYDTCCKSCAMSRGATWTHDNDCNQRNNISLNHNGGIMSNHSHAIHNNIHNNHPSPKSIAPDIDNTQQNQNAVSMDNNSKMHNSQYKINVIGQGRGRGRGRGRGSGRGRGHVINRDNKNGQNPNYNTMAAKKQIKDIKLVKSNISNIIDHEFKEQHLYHIHIDDDNQHLFGILLPKAIPNEELEHIKIPVQILTDSEQQIRDFITFFAENDLNEKQVFETKEKLVTIKKISQNDSNQYILSKTYQQKIVTFNKFIFKLLDNKYQKLKEREDKQQRFYLLVPLKRSHNKSSVDIDFECIEQVCKGSDGDINGCKWMQHYLKDQLVRVQGTNGKYELCISYGKLNNAVINADNDDDAKIKEQGFADELMAKYWNSLHVYNPKKYQKKQVLFSRKIATKIPNILNVYNPSITGNALKGSLGFKPLHVVYPTGVTSQMWYTLKNMPAILWMIENWLNVIDLKQKLQNVAINDNDDIKGNEDDAKIDIDTTLLFSALNRTPSGNTKPIDILNNLGAYMLKALLTLYKFSDNATAPVTVIREYVENRMDKKFKNIHYKVLINVALKWNILSFAILKDFSFQRWNPPAFEFREKDSLYKSDRNDSGAFIIQSIIGVCWWSCMNNSDVADSKLFSYTIKQTMKLLYHLGIISKPFHIDDKFEGIPPVFDENAMKLQAVAIINKLEPSYIFNASLISICTERKRSNKDKGRFEDQGITLERLAILGDAILDMMVIWHVCKEMFDDDTFLPKIACKFKIKDDILWHEEITKARHAWVSNEVLAKRVAIAGLYKYITWFNKDEGIAIEHFAKDLKELHEITQIETSGNGENEEEKKDINDDGTVITDTSMVNDVNEELRTPRGDEIGNKRNTKKEQLANKCLGTIFEAILGAVFVGSNHKMYSNASLLQHSNFELQPVIEFLVSFLGNHSVWKKTMKPYLSDCTKTY